MRTIVKTETVPAEEVTTTTYGCDLCDFVADDKDDVERHYAKEHACKRTMEAEGTSLYWFDSKEDAETWLEHDEYGSDEHEIYWSDPGWYHISQSTRPCLRGCCTRNCFSLEPVGVFLAELECSAKRNEEQADATRRRAQAIRRQVGDG